MRGGYGISGSKIKEKNPFGQKSRSKKEYPFLLDQDDDLGLATSSSRSKQTKCGNQEQPFNATVNDVEKTLLRRDSHWLFKDKFNGGERKGPAPILRRNFSATSVYQRNKSNGNILEWQSSSRSNIQGAMKRAFSMKIKRSSSANSHSEYCRIIHDQDHQPLRGDHRNDIDNHDYDDDYYYNDDHQDEGDFDGNDSNGSMQKRSLSMKQKTSNSKSKVFKACKRLFSRKFA